MLQPQIQNQQAVMQDRTDTIGRVSYLIYVSMRHYVLTTSGDSRMFSYSSMFELLIC